MQRMLRFESMGNVGTNSIRVFDPKREGPIGVIIRSKKDRSRLLFDSNIYTLTHEEMREIVEKMNDIAQELEFKK